MPFHQQGEKKKSSVFVFFSFIFWRLSPDPLLVPSDYGNVSLKMCVPHLPFFNLMIVTDHIYITYSNVKLRGINSVLDSSGLGPIAEKPTMVFGAGVSHPSPGSLAPSIAAVVGSMDAKVYSPLLTFLLSLSADQSEFAFQVSLYGTCIKIQTCECQLSLPRFLQAWAKVNFFTPARVEVIGQLDSMVEVCAFPSLLRDLHADPFGTLPLRRRF